MTEPVTEEVVEEKNVEAPSEPQYTEVETAAMEQGWLPKDQWEEAGKDPAEWRSAKEFQERGEFFSTIHQLKRDNKNLSQGLDSMRRHHQFVFDQAYRKAQNDLKRERRQAMQMEDLDRVEQIESEIEELNTEYTKQRQDLEKIEVQPKQAPELAAFVARNPWYETDGELRDEADAIGLIYSNRNPGKSAQEILTHVEKTIKKRNPDKFGGVRTAPNAVAAVDRTKSKSKSTSYQLTEMEEKICNDIVRTGVMTRAEYIADLKKIKGE